MPFHILLVLSFMTPMIHAADVLSIDPCDALVRKNGNLVDVLKPQYRAMDLIQKITEGEFFHYILGLEEDLEISIQVSQDTPRVPVIVKTHANPQISRKSAALQAHLKELKAQGFLPGFQLFEHIRQEGRSNYFKFEEGRELVSLPGDMEDLANPNLRALHRSYEIRLNHVRQALERAGVAIELYRPEGDLPHLVGTHNGQSQIYISPYHIWVTTDGRFLIFDPL